jgi:transmembrane protein EpsG
MTDYMTVFASIVVFCYFTAAVAKLYARRPGDLGQPKPNILGFIIPAVLFTTFSGLRHGLGDTEFYIHSYNLLDPTRIDSSSWKLGGGVMYNIMQQFFRLRTDDPTPLIFLTAILSCVPIIYVIYKYAHPYELGIYLFVTTSYYTFSMNGIRQYMAAGVLILGTKYLFSENNKDFFKYLFFVLCAWLFHTSALIMIPVYFIARRRAWSWLTIFLLVVTAVVTMMFDVFLPTFLNIIENTDYSEYAYNEWFTSGREAGSNAIRVAVLFIPMVLAFLQRHRMEVLGRFGDVIINMSIVNILFYILSLYNWIFARFAIYTSVFPILLITWLITLAFKRRDSSIAYWTTVCLYAIYFYNVKYSIIYYTSVKF